MGKAKEIAEYIFALVLFLPLSAATIRFAFYRILPPPTGAVMKFFTGLGWAFLAIMFSVATIGSFARGKSFAAPWAEFSFRLSLHGLEDACAGAWVVTLADIWWFFGFSQLILWSQETGPNPRTIEIQALRRRLYLVINILVGLLVTTEGNPIYRFLAT